MPAARIAGAATLCDNDDVNRVSRLEVGHARAEEMVRSPHDRVVDDQAWRAVPAIDGTQPNAQVFGVAGIRRDRVDVGTRVRQIAGESPEAVGAAGDQGDSVTALSGPTSHGHSEAGPGADQQQVAAVDPVSWSLAWRCACHGGLLTRWRWLMAFQATAVQTSEGVEPMRRVQCNRRRLVCHEWRVATASFAARRTPHSARPWIGHIRAPRLNDKTARVRGGLTGATRVFHGRDGSFTGARWLPSWKLRPRRCRRSAAWLGLRLSRPASEKRKSQP